jgi:hypothetical protein
MFYQLRITKFLSVTEENDGAKAKFYEYRNNDNRQWWRRGHPLAHYRFARLFGFQSRRLFVLLDSQFPGRA